MSGRTPLADAVTELIQKYGYTDVTDSVKPYYTEGFNHLYVFLLPNGEPHYCDSIGDVLECLENARSGILHTLEIYVPSAETFIVARHGKAIDQWQQWEAEARQVAEPLVKARWSTYWDEVAQEATHRRTATSLADVMQLLPLPGKYYPCPKDLQAKIVGCVQ